MEVHKRPAGKDAVVDMDFLNITGENGLQSIPLDQVQSVRFLNPVLDGEFQRALRVVASSHDKQKKSVSLGFTGQGKRKVKVGYVIEQPIWKTSYRLRIETDGKSFIQGWAIVENTSDDDWNDVRMVLVSGRPISFKMDMYEPLYIPRPTVEPELFASLRPPVYGGAMDKDSKSSRERNFRLRSCKDAIEALPKLREEELESLDGRKREKMSKDLAKLAGKAEAESGYGSRKTAEALNFKEGIESVATASELGEYYQYVIDQHITLPRQKSAMLPVLDPAHRRVQGQHLQ